MILKRIPLFIIGLLYGAIVNSVVLGICYGIWAAGMAIAVVCRLLRPPNCMSAAAADIPVEDKTRPPAKSILTQLEISEVIYSFFYPGKGSTHPRHPHRHPSLQSME